MHMQCPTFTSAHSVSALNATIEDVGKRKYNTHHEWNQEKKVSIQTGRFRLLQEVKPFKDQTIN